MKHPVFVFGLTLVRTINDGGEIIEKKKIDNVKVEGYEQALFYANNSIPARCVGSTIEVYQGHIDNPNEKHSDESVSKMCLAIEEILRKKNKFISTKKKEAVPPVQPVPESGNQEPENPESGNVDPKSVEEQKKDFLIKSIIELGGKADKRSSVETLEEKLLELQEGGDNGDTE